MRGAVGVVVGLVAFAWPGLTILTLIGIFAAYALLDGITTLWLGLALSGILSAGFGLLLFAFPALGLFGIAWALAAYALASGIVLIALGFRLRKPARVQG
jgi:uncharacterized membrane protein HdeD (DUF308 family)